MGKSGLIIGLTGTNASGKGTVAQFLKKNGFAYHSLSDVIRDELTSSGLAITRESMIGRGNELRVKFGPAVLAKRITGKLKGGNCIIDSIRNTSEVNELRKLDSFFLVCVDAPIEMRFERAMKRGRLENASTVEEFRAMEEKEKSKDSNAQQIDKCMRMSDIKILNEGTIEELYEKTEAILRDLEKKQA